MRILLLFLILLVSCNQQPKNEEARLVAGQFKASNLFPKENVVTDITHKLPDMEKDEGVLSAVNIESSDVAGVTIKVYRSDSERNNARLRMVKECPGCNLVTECGRILVYTPYSKAKDINEILYQRSEEYYGVMGRRFNCK